MTFALRFAPILAGATFRDRLLACAGAALGIGITGLLCGWLLGAGQGWLLIVAPMGASAVLVYAVPASPLAQPWPVIGGNLLSAVVGVLVAWLVPVPALAAGLAVGGAILLMSLTRSLHPPGGAVALSSALAYPASVAAALLPVGANALVLVGAGLLFHRLSGHSYPHRAAAGPAVRTFALPHPEDLDRALAEMGETFDVSREDLDQLLGRVAALEEARRGRQGSILSS